MPKTAPTQKKEHGLKGKKSNAFKGHTARFMVCMPEPVKSKLKQVAKERKCKMNDLALSAICREIDPQRLLDV